MSREIFHVHSFDTRAARAQSHSTVCRPDIENNMIFKRFSVAAFALFGLSSPTWAADFTMSFDNIPFATPSPPAPNQQFGSAVLGFYNGDPVYQRAGAQDYGVNFSDNALAICEKTSINDPCSGIFPSPPSPPSAVGLVTGTSFDLELIAGLFISKMSFSYGQTGTGSNTAIELFSLSQSVFTINLGGCTDTGFCWQDFSVPQQNLDGSLITKIVFSSNQNSSVFDNIALSTAPIPEPSTYALLLVGLAVVAAARRRNIG